MSRVRIGVIGCGVIGMHHIRHASEADHIELVAVADLEQEKRDRAAAEYGVPHAHSDGDALIADPDVEAVVLAMPACLRTELALRAFAAGKHVLTEKPVAMNAGEVKRMLDAKGDLVAACCSSRYQFLPSTQAARKFIATGALGTLRVLRARGIQPKNPPKGPPVPWRLSLAANGGGIFANWGCYDLDYLMGLTGWLLRPRLVLAKTWTVPRRFESYVAEGSDAETHLAAIVECDGGTVIMFERGEYVPARADAAWEIIGEDGSLSLVMTPEDGKRLVHYEAVTDRGVAEYVLWEGEENNAQVHAGPVSDFAHAILEGREPMTGLEKSLILQKITDAVYASSRTNGAVTIS